MVSLICSLFIYCTRNINKIKTRGVHKYITFCLFKKYTADTYKDNMKKVNFPNYELFNDINEAYSSFFQKIKIVVDNTAPCLTKRVQVNTQKWFDGELLESKNTRDKLFKRFRKPRLHNDN